MSCKKFIVDEFLKEKMPDLVQRVTNVMQIADKMLSTHLIKEEQYSKIKAEATDQDKMRRIFDYLRSCGPPQKRLFFKILQHLHHSLLQDLGWHSEGSEVHFSDLLSEGFH